MPRRVNTFFLNVPRTYRPYEGAMVSGFMGTAHETRCKVGTVPSAGLFLPVSSHQSTAYGVAVTKPSPAAALDGTSNALKIARTPTGKVRHFLSIHAPVDF